MINEIKLNVSSVLYSLTVLTLSGSMLQTFLLEGGCTENSVASLLALLQLIQLATIFLFSQISDKAKNVKLATALSFLLALPLAVYFTVISASGAGVNMHLVFAFGALFNVYLGLYNILSLKLPYFAIDMERYGIYSSVSSALGGGFGLGASLIISALLTVYGFNAVMTDVYFITSLFVLLSFAVTLSIKNRGEPVLAEAKASKVSLFKYKHFVYLALPNLLRGFCAGVIGTSVTIGYFVGTIDGSTAPIIVTVSGAASILSSLFYAFIIKHVSEKTVILLASVSTFIFMPLTVATESTNLFILFYACAFFSVQLINIAVPIIIVKTVDYGMIGKYSGGRMILHTLGMSLAGFVLIPLLNGIGAIGAMLLSGGLQLVCGLAYYLFFRKKRYFTEG